MAGLYEITGAVAELRWGYYAAATLRDVTLTRTLDGWSLTATIVSAHTMRCSQQPLVCVMARTSWTWPVLSLQMAETTLTASLGPEGSAHALTLRPT